MPQQATPAAIDPVPAPKKKPFIPPLLGAKNLGMSTLIQANGKTQEENDVAKNVGSNIQAPPQPAQIQPPQQKKKPFIPPLLGAKNLGMSTLIQANGKTQEENDVSN